MDTPARDPVDVVRRFNRSHAQRSGTVAESFLETGRAYGPSRVLFEVGAAGATARDLRTRLELDSGYLSRLLRQLEAEGLVTTDPDPADGRRRTVQLTPAGVTAWNELDARSDERAAAMLDGLSDRQRDRLAALLEEADRLLLAASTEFAAIDPESATAIEAMTTYFDELDRRFAGGFDPGDTLTADAPAMRAPAGAFVVARADGRLAGCGGVVRHDDRTGEIKRMWVHADWRGCGVGARLLAALEATVTELGYERIVLDTNETLSEAIAMYERAGYTPIERYNGNPYAHRWFEKRPT